MDRLEQHICGRTYLLPARGLKPEDFNLVYYFITSRTYLLPARGLKLIVKFLPFLWRCQGRTYILPARGLKQHTGKAKPN
ncbi:hypothetical protein [Microseira wollei]|uniref:hypothetical protein n=1 Tax=Microseira wollei TaxID=467598 RepID=UPI00403941B0